VIPLFKFGSVDSNPRRHKITDGCITLPHQWLNDNGQYASVQNLLLKSFSEFTVWDKGRSTEARGLALMHFVLRNTPRPWCFWAMGWCHTD